MKFILLASIFFSLSAHSNKLIKMNGQNCLQKSAIMNKKFYCPGDKVFISMNEAGRMKAVFPIVAESQAFVPFLRLHGLGEIERVINRDLVRVKINYRCIKCR